MYIIKTKCSLLIYNKAIVYVDFKYYTYISMWRVEDNVHCTSFNR